MTFSIIEEPIPLKIDADGVVRIGGTRVTLDTIVYAFKQGMAAEEIMQQYPSVQLANIYYAIGYFLRRQSEVEEYLREREQQAEEIRALYSQPVDVQGLRERVLARRPAAREEEFRRMAQLWSEYVRTRLDLQQANFLRSYKSAEADLAEWLVKDVFRGELVVSKSNPAYDVVAGDMRIEVKSINKMIGNKNGYKIKERDKENHSDTGATHYAFVFFKNFMPDAIFLVPESFLRSFPRPQIRRADLESRSEFRVEADLTPFKQVASAWSLQESA
ncbi:MAG TPA: DUF433 domain-containing protein [Chloroflexia bacterium]|nr:DUF433 domain-containing protein [Chloroflexia bacterium]